MRLDKAASSGAKRAVRLTKYYYGCQIKKNEKDAAYDTYGGEEKFVYGFGRKM
jgi:hypothetical protein